MTVCSAIRWIGERTSDASATTFAIAKVTMTLSSVDDRVGDTVATLNNIYLALRSERPQDHLNEYAMVHLTPRVAGDSPINETLQTAWKSLQAFGDKHIGPNIGTIRASQEDVLSQIYTRCAWKTGPATQHYLHLPGGPRRFRLRSQYDALFEIQHAYG